MPELEHSLAKDIRESEKTHTPAETWLETDEQVLARITDGIYRQPSSALRELISNAYDADATEVVVLTDAPRFGQISVRDNGLGLSPEVVDHLIKHIGGSPKRTDEGAELGVTSKNDANRSPGGCELIGKLGIGLFSVAQFTRHFLIITKTKGDSYRTIADITLGRVVGQQEPLAVREGKLEIKTGHARIWRERASDKESHGTEIKLLELLPRTRDELASLDLWARLDYEKETEGRALSPEPKLHIGRVRRDDSGELLVQPRLPWEQKDKPKQRFIKLVEAVRGLAQVDANLVDLTKVCDTYLQTLWTLSLAAPLEYIECHPFDLSVQDEIQFFRLENQTGGQASPMDLKRGDTPRKVLELKTPTFKSGDKFVVTIDGVQLFRPITFRNQVKTKTAVKTPLLFVGKDRARVSRKARVH